jgi:hypothetical protein
MNQTQLKQFSILFSNKWWFKHIPWNKYEMKLQEYPCSYSRNERYTHKCYSGFKTYPSTNTQSDQTYERFTYFPQMIAWPQKNHVLSDETNNNTHQDMLIRPTSTPRHKHWVGHNWRNIPSFPATDSFKHIPWTIQVESTRIIMFLLTELTILFTGCHSG